MNISFIENIYIIKDILYQINEYLRYPILRTKTVEVSIWAMFIFSFIILISRFIAKKTSELVIFKLLNKEQFEVGRKDSIAKIITYTIYIIGIIIALQTLGINLSALIAGGAILAVGIGFGVQNLVSNFISGILILFEQPIKKNDFVEVDGVLGVINEISIRSTTITTLDNITIIMPNSKFITEKVINWTHNESKSRISIKIGVSYNSNIELVEKLLLSVANKEDFVVKSPEPLVYFNEFGDSSLNFELLVWIIKPIKHRLIKSKLNFAIFNILKENNIEIPFPQRDINIKSSV
ncbi:MAG: mechanosensitive ion channel [Candidatus Sericytochromatia bacterium]